MAKIIFRQEAIHDLNEIWSYTFKKWSENQADKYYSALEFACIQLSQNPELAKEYDGIQKKNTWFENWETYHFLSGNHKSRN